MPKGKPLVTNFSAGELDPKLRGRVDLEAYVQGADRYRNLQTFAAGGARPRPGLRYRQTLTGRHRAIEFIYDDDEKYILLLGHGTVSFYTDTGSFIQTIATSWPLSQVNNITYSQLYDKMFLAHRDYPTQVITRTGLSSFTMAEMSFETYSTGMSKKPFWAYAPADYGIQLSNVSGSVACGVYKDNGSTPVTDFWSADWIGRRIRINSSSADNVGEIVINGPYVPGSQDIAATIIGTPTTAGTLPVAGFTTDWSEEAFNQYRGYPAAVGLYDQRLWFGGGKSAPEGLWASRVNGFFDFAIGDGDDNPVQFGLVGDRVQEIRHIVAPKNVGFLTRDGEWIHEATAGENAITPSNFKPKQNTKYGAGYGVKPIFYDGSIVFPQKSGNTIREMRWEELQQVYDAPSLSLMAGHLIRNPCDSAVRYGTPERPEQFAYFVNDDGSIAVFHGIRDQRIAGWGLWHLGETHEGDGGITMDTTAYTMDSTTAFRMDAHSPEGKFHSVVSLDEKLFAVCEREGVFTLEEFDESLSVDMAISVARTNAGKTFNGLQPLEGKTVWAVWDGYVLGSGTVVDGTLDLSSASIPDVTDVEIGLFMGWHLRLMPSDFASAGGTQQGNVRRITRATILPEKLGRVRINGWPLLLKTQTIGGATLSVPTSEPKSFPLLGYSRDPMIEIKNDQPTTGAILSIHAEMVAE